MPLPECPEVQLLAYAAFLLKAQQWLLTVLWMTACQHRTRKQEVPSGILCPPTPILQRSKRRPREDHTASHGPLWN